ncbi:MAG: NYN domain-containing protein [Anaerolineales bacterium]|nr:NYN domain-containing protein [Anaerolineales bacterium]
MTEMESADLKSALEELEEKLILDGPMNNDIAIFLDLDNIVIGATEVNLTFDVNTVLNAIREMTNGRVVLRRAYGDWRQNKKMPKQLASAGFELQSAVRLSSSSKNLADMQMVVDAMETLIDGHNFSTYVLVTGDRDFLPLVQTLRKRGKQVVGIGLKHTTSQSLIDLCDHYLFYEDIAHQIGQQPFGDVSDLLQQAVDELTGESGRVQASLVKERMQSLSQGAFGKSPQGKKNFSKFLSQFPDIIQLFHEGTTLYVAPAGVRIKKSESAPTPAVELDTATIETLLKAAVQELVSPQGRVRASLVKEHLRQATNGAFDEARLGDNSFRSFLLRYPHIVQVQQSGTTVYVLNPEQQPVSDELYLQYRSNLKKKGLRVVEHPVRLTVLRDLIDILQKEKENRWKQVVDDLANRYEARDGRSISKSLIHDVIRLAKRAQVISQQGNQRSLAATPIKLELTGDKLFQEAVMRCDSAYLQVIEHLPEPFDLTQAALALYDDESYTRYLKVLRSRSQLNGSGD